MDATPAPAPRRGPGRKARVRALLVERDLEGVADLAAGSRGVPGTLVALTFDPDPLVAWRAVEATGVAVGRLADVAPERAREHLRRLFWLVTEESGGICWRAPEAMAEIVARRPDRFGEYVPIVAHLLLEFAEEDLEHFRPGVLWAIGRMGPLAASTLRDDAALRAAVLACLDHFDAAVRGAAAWCLGRAGGADVLRARPDLTGDEGELELYLDGALRPTTVGAVVAGALEAAGGGTIRG